MRRFFLLCQREDGGAMLFVLSLTIILTITMSVFFLSSRVTTRSSGIRRESTAALNVAEAGKERFLAELRDDTILPNQKWTVFKDESLGKGKYTVICSTGANPDTVTILSEGEEGGFNKKIEVIAVRKRMLPIESLGVRIPAALLCRGEVELKGTGDIDGRDHPANAQNPGDNIGDGVFGVLTCGSFSINGNGSVWGRGKGPATKKNNYTRLKDTVYRENVFPCVVPSTPEEVLGLLPGALDKYKIKASQFNQPFEGIIYVTESVGNIKDISKGILIVHNSSCNASINNINANARIEGIIICDDISHINGGATIVGAVVVLSPNQSVVNGNGAILYSRETLDNLDRHVSDMREWSVEQVGWREISD